MRATALILAVVLIAPGGAASAVDLPKSITPALRAACEKDVRRLCVTKNSTYRSVKACVMRKFSALNTTCKLRIARAGLL